MEELHNLKMKILRSKHISDQLREELANDVSEIESSIKANNEVDNVGSLEYESFATTSEAVRWVNRNKDKTLVTITSEQYGVTVYYR